MALENLCWAAAGGWTVVDARRRARPRMGGGTRGQRAGRQRRRSADGAQAAADGTGSRRWGAAGGDGSTAMEDGSRDRQPEEERGRHLDRWSSQIRDGRRPC